MHNAGSSAEVLRQVKAYSFDIIFSDYQLEDGRDGQQLLEELRQKHLISLSTVFMVITAERAYHNVVSLAELAPDDYLIKPFWPINCMPVWSGQSTRSSSLQRYSGIWITGHLPMRWWPVSC
ncbi:MAG: response regulator [Propionivibrio sp.]|uniref:Response regulator n=1 Tax=Candidatus Propionivibrio dominans TaxID=2954373 RepID=A0A9D7FAL1_9RHOO|nr:response regulator [Candidatus Propionivibrio dominans]